MDYTKLSKEELQKEYESVKAEYDRLAAKGLSLDMSRGKPGFENADLSEDLLTAVCREKGYKNKEGIDCRNYGGVDGILEMKELFAEMLSLKPSQVIVAGNSSLTLMYDVISQAITHGLGAEPMYKCENRKFICLVPGYDRHFAIAEHFGFELISVPINDNGPDMDRIEELVKDESVKGVWCVPKYSNPYGNSYSDEVVRRFANLKPAAKDFHLFWDNAYCVHDLYEEKDEILNIYDECVKAGNPDLPIIFASTSKISIPGDGVAAMAGSEKNMDMLRKRLVFQTVGPDKINMLRHARKFPNLAALLEQMKKHADIIRPKFQTVLEAFSNDLGGKGIARWTNPKGGYFISLFCMDGCAKRVHTLCKEAGVVLTGAGASYPHGIDPADSHLRIAPTYPTPENLKAAAEVLCVAVKLAALEKLTGNKG